MPNELERVPRTRTILLWGARLLVVAALAALLLAARRQRSAELDLVQKDHDATERRVTEIYGKAADQLGSDKAPVRLAGLCALERLAGGYAEHRQTIVNVRCSYVRMPVGGPGENLEELQVRKTAQRILLVHRRPGPARPTGRTGASGRTSAST
ncbi:hypothetical protein [Amycolatopsis australiensis]|uniref:hypothetical protein n=1 Tax=Amycolatopsis australiensis TaxID=546364 RepID=UPI000B24DB9D|nr:hypothetical protein [Amycolatopsis australiensis]